MKSNGYQRISKPVLDVVIAATMLALLSPVLLAIAFLIRAKCGPPILFRQRRPGLKSKPFTLYKFRSMTEARAADGQLLTDAERLTEFGRFLRATSLDELPELLNVLKGEMSIVGPRPLLMQYIDRYTPEQARRHEVRPGITGWAQINGRNAITWEQKFELDIWYVDHVSPTLDVRIIAQTIWKTLTRENITAPGQATMQEFIEKKP